MDKKPQFVNAHLARVMIAAFLVNLCFSRPSHFETTIKDFRNHRPRARDSLLVRMTKWASVQLLGYYT